jgi:hypothetical protein
MHLNPGQRSFQRRNRYALVALSRNVDRVITDLHAPDPVFNPTTILSAQKMSCFGSSSIAILVAIPY